MNGLKNVYFSQLLKKNRFVITAEAVVMTPVENNNFTKSLRFPIPQTLGVLLKLFAYGNRVYITVTLI